MAIPTFVAAGTIGAGTAEVTPGMPAGATTDDLLLLHIAGDGLAPADDAPTGGAWTLIGSVTSDESGVSDKTRHTVHWAWYDAAINLTVPDAGEHTLAVITAWRGVDTTTPIHGSQSSFHATNDTTVSATGFNTTINDCLIVVSTSAGDNISFSGWANANLSDVTERADVLTGAGSDSAIGVASGGLATAGATGTTTATASLVEEEANWVIALTPVQSAPITDTALTNTSTLYTDTVGAPKITDAALTNTSTLYQDALEATRYVVDVLLTNTNTFYVDTLEATRVLAEALLTNTSTLYQDALEATRYISDPALASINELFTDVVRGDVNIDPWWIWCLVRQDGHLMLAPLKSLGGWAGADIVSDNFRFTTAISNYTMSKIAAVWAAHSGSPTATLKTEINAALSTAGIKNPQGLPL